MALREETASTTQNIWTATDSHEEACPPVIEKKKSWKEKLFKRKKKSSSQEPISEARPPQVPPSGQIPPFSGQMVPNSSFLVPQSGPLVPNSGEVSVPSSGELLAPPKKRVFVGEALSKEIVPEEGSGSDAAGAPPKEAPKPERTVSMGVVKVSEDGFSDGQVKELTEVFKHFDANGDGKISAPELGAVLRALGDSPSKQEVDAMIKSVDVDGDGHIDLEEFLRLHQMALAPGSPADPENELQTAFEVFDLDKNGYITATELKAVLGSLGQDCCPEECARIIKAVDADGDGQVCFAEFRNMMGAVINV